MRRLGSHCCSRLESSEHRMMAREDQHGCNVRCVCVQVSLPEPLQPSQHAQQAASLQQPGNSATAPPQAPGWRLGCGAAPPAAAPAGAAVSRAAPAAAAPPGPSAAARSPAGAGTAAFAATSATTPANLGDCGCCIDLTGEGSDDGGGYARTAGAAPDLAPSAIRSFNVPSGGACGAQQERPAPAAAHGPPWACSLCTLHNGAEMAACAACGGPSPQLQRAAAAPPPVQATARHWACETCTLGNDETNSHCGACGSWRFASSLPVAGQAL